MSVIPQSGDLFGSFGKAFSGLNPWSSAASIGLDMIKSRIASKQAERTQRRLQNSSAELQLKNAMAMAEYNSPKNMRSRMEEAGYNIGAQMGQLSGSAGQLGSAPTGGTPGVSYTPLSDSQIQLNKSAARLNDAKAGTEESTQILQSATAELQSVLARVGLQDEKLKAVEAFIADQTKHNAIGMSSASFKAALLNLDQLQTDILNNKRRGRLLDIEIRSAKQNLVRLGVETWVSYLTGKEKIENASMLRSLALYYSTQTGDLVDKSMSDYWQNLSDSYRWSAAASRRSYHWAPYMNVGALSSEAVSAACKALGVVIDYKTLGLTRALSNRTSTTEFYNAAGAFIGGKTTTTR